MKAARYIAGMVAVAAAAMVSMFPGAAKAQGNAIITFSSGIQVQNLSSTAASIDIAFYPLKNGTASVSVPATVPANGSLIYAQLPSQVAAGFDGSAVISSDQRIAATVNIVSPDINTFGSTGLGGGTYAGVTSGSPTVRLPLLFKNVAGFSTFYNVQNVGTTATNISVAYQNGGTDTFANLAPGASVRFNQNENTGIPNGFVGAATITSSSSDIAAVVTQVGKTTVLIYNGFSSAGSQAPVFPLVNANNSGFITGITLQNAGTVATTATVSYTPALNSQGTAQGVACAETLTIQPGASANFAVDAFAKDVAGENCAKVNLFVGSGRVTANTGSQPLVAIVNQLNSATNKGGAYAGFDPATATDTVVYPLIQDRVSGFFTGIAVYNAGTVDTAVECTFTNSQVKQTTTAPLKPGESFSVVQNNVIANSYSGAGTCKATAAGAKIVGTANQVRVTGTKDTLFVYEGITN